MAAKKTQKRMPRRREEFTYHGLRIEDLQAMSMTDLLPVMPSRARRKVLRGLSRDEEHLLSRFRNGDARIRTHLRSMVVFFFNDTATTEIYTGKEFQKVELQP